MTEMIKDLKAGLPTMMVVISIILTATVSTTLYISSIESRVTANESEISNINGFIQNSMKDIVDKVREFEILRGNGIKRPADCENTTRINNRKSIVVEKALKEGERITRNSIGIKRPGYGVQPRYFDQILGKRVNKDLERDDVLTWEDFG